MIDRTRWLRLSSSIFLIPSWYAYYKGQPLLSILGVAQSLPYYGNTDCVSRQWFDWSVSCVSYGIFTYLRFCKAPSYLSVGFGLSRLAMIAYYYTHSSILRNLQNPIWVKYRILSHGVAAFEQLAVVLYLI
jgi:hypothetical protein